MPSFKNSINTVQIYLNKGTGMLQNFMLWNHYYELNTVYSFVRVGANA